MNDFSYSDVTNLLFHLILTVIYVYMVVQVRRAQNFVEDAVAFRLSRFARTAAMIGGFLALGSGLILFALFWYSLAEATFMNIPMSTQSSLQYSFNLLSAIMVTVAGIWVIGSFPFAFGLYFISILVLLTTSLYGLALEKETVVPMVSDIVAISCAVGLLLAGGVSAASEYFKSLQRIPESKIRKLRPI